MEEVLGPDIEVFPVVPTRRADHPSRHTNLQTHHRELCTGIQPCLTWFPSRLTKGNVATEWNSNNRNSSSSSDNARSDKFITIGQE